MSWLTVVVVSFFASLGLAVGVGAVLPGTAPRTGGNPFAATSGGAAQGCLTAIVSFVGPMLLTLPAVVVAILTSGSGVGRWVGLAVGTAYGLGLLAVGVAARAAPRIDRHAPGAARPARHRPDLTRPDRPQLSRPMREPSPSHRFRSPAR